jgi:spore cortex biosynthesis protein YabQ
MIIPETFFTVREQLILFGLSCIGGAALGLVFEIFRTVRTFLPHNFWLVVIEDVLFMALYAVFLNAFSLAAARGEFRFYYVIGNVLGFIFYICTVGNVASAALRKLCGFLKMIITLIMRPIFKVYAFIYKKILVEFVGSNKCLVKSVKYSKNLLQNMRRMLYNKKESKNRKNVTNVAKKSQNKKKEKKIV